MYEHIRHDQRVALAALARAGYTQAGAAREIGVDPSTVSRELRRNAGEDGLYDIRCADREGTEQTCGREEGNAYD